jgi:cell division protein FtsB
MIEWRFGNWYHVHKKSHIYVDYTVQWNHFKNEYNKKGKWLKNVKSLLVNTMEMTKVVGLSLLRASLTLLFQVCKKVKSLITKGW